MNAHAEIPSPFLDDRFQTEIEMIGALLSQTTTAGFHAAAAIVGPEHFCDNFNARLFARMGEGIKSGLSGFRLIQWLIAELRDDATLAEARITASGIIARMISNACPEIGIEGAARQIRHDWLKDHLQEAVTDGDTAAAETIAAEMEKLSRAHLSKDAGIASVGTSSSAVLERLAETFSTGAVADDMAWPGSRKLADVLGGFRRGRMYIIGGRPGGGKTTTGLSLLLRTALKGHGVMFFELEMSAAELTEMALCDLAWSRKGRIEYRDLSRQDVVASPAFKSRIDALSEAHGTLRNLPFVISDRPGLTVSEIRSQAMQYAQRLAAAGKRLDVVCIDHMNLVKPSANYAGNKVAETEEVSNALKALAKELQCAVVVLCQLNRGVEHKEDKRPGLADLRWSGAVEQDADVVMFVYREAYYLSKPVDDPVADMTRLDRLRDVENKLELIVAKHRGGPTPVLEFFCDMGCGVVRDLDGVR